MVFAQSRWFKVNRLDLWGRAFLQAAAALYLKKVELRWLFSAWGTSKREGWGDQAFFFVNGYAWIWIRACLPPQHTIKRLHVKFNSVWSWMNPNILMILRIYKHYLAARNIHILFHEQTVYVRGTKWKKGLPDHIVNGHSHVPLLFHGRGKSQRLHYSKNWF